MLAATTPSQDWEPEEEFAKLIALEADLSNDAAEGSGVKKCASDDFILLGGVQPGEPSPTEHCWEPMRRWNSMQKQLRMPRGAKSVEHLEILRVSDPSYGTLAPRKVRGSATEYTYDPMTRWNAMQKQLREPRGAKSFEHLKNLRVSDMSALMGSQWTERGPTVGWRKDEFADSERPSGHLPSFLVGGSDELQRELEGDLEGTPARVKPLVQSGVPDVGVPYLGVPCSTRADVPLPHLVPSGDEEVSSSTAESWQPLRPAGGRLPRILSNQVLADLARDEDCLFELECGESPLASYRFPGSARLVSHRTRSSSFDSDDLEGESLRSAALTAYERSSRHEERASNDTIGSFLDDHDHLPTTPRSPMRLGERGGGWAPPRGTFKDAEMAARFAAKAKGFEADEIHGASRPKHAQKAGHKSSAAGKGKMKEVPAPDPLGKRALLDMF